VADALLRLHARSRRARVHSWTACSVSMPCFSGCPPGRDDRRARGPGAPVGRDLRHRPGHRASGERPALRLLADRDRLADGPDPRPRRFGLGARRWHTPRRGQLLGPRDRLFGLDSTRPSDTITAIHLLTWEGISPPVDRSAWTPIGRFVYRGGITTGSAGHSERVPGSEVEIRFLAAALEIDDGTVPHRLRPPAAVPGVVHRVPPRRCRASPRVGVPTR
jgi:hypothetical protein